LTPRAPKSARDIAAHVIARVLRDQAYASAVLESAIEGGPERDRRDVALATELTYGVLRTYGALDRALLKYATKKKPLSQPEAHAHLLIGAYQLLFLDRVPAHAAVNEAVSAVRRFMGDAPSRYANALLRKLASETTRPTMAEAISESLPKWIREALGRSIGEANVVAFVGDGSAPPLGLALRKDIDRAKLLATLSKENPAASFDAGRVSPRAILCTKAADPRALTGHGDDFIVQEEGAQALSLLVGARSGERVLDACAGRGNKAFLLADEVTSAGVVVATDLHPNKVKHAARWASQTLSIDWTVGVGAVPDDFDHALVDAPCSGIGTIRRRPEIALHRKPESLEVLRETQTSILARVATRVRDGGHVVYAVCSVLEAECEAVIADATARARASGVVLTPSPFDVVDRGPLRDLVDGRSTLRLLPHEHGTDGYFAARFRVGGHL
jgi:16S rRNA (cytosine967-C5)-methyltransferase